MYYDFVKNSLHKYESIDLLYCGEKISLSSTDGGGILFVNCRTGEKKVYADFSELELNQNIMDALNEKDRSIVWADLKSHQMFAEEKEFILQLELGGEVEFIYHGVGFFIGRCMIGEKNGWQVINAFSHEKQNFDNVNQLLNNALLLQNQLKLCIPEIEIISYM